MIYLKNNTDKQDCFIPKNGEYVGKKTYKEGVEYQKSLIEPITITDNGVYENENGYSPVDVNIPFGSTTITENGVYDTRNGYVAKSDEVIGDYWQMQGGGFLFQLGGAYNNIKMQVLFKPLNEVGEYFPDLMRGIIGSYAQNFYIAEEIENPYKIFACVGDWQSEHIEITNDWHLLSLSKTEFTIDGKVVGIVPEGTDVAVTTIFLNGLDDANTNNYYYPNLGEYSDVKIWCDDDLLFDCVYFYEGNQNGEYGYLNKVDNQLVINNWKVTNNWLHIGYTRDYKLKNVRALDYVEVSVVAGDVNIVDKVIRLTDEDRTSVNALEEGVDGFRNVEVDASILANRRFEQGYQAGVNSGEGGCDLEPLYTSPTWDERDENNYVNYTPGEGKDGFDEVHINLQPTYEQGYNDGISQGSDGECNIGELRTNFEDYGEGKWWRGANEDGLDGYGYVEINASEYGDQKYNQGYEQGYNDGQANCGEGGGCVLEHLEVNENGWYEPKAQEFDYLKVNENSAFDTGVKLVDNSTIEIYFNTGSNWDNIPTLVGCEDTDWSESTFAVRWYNDALEVKIGACNVYIPIGAEDEGTNFHKLKFGRYEGVWFDEEYKGSLDYDTWAMTQNTIYIGAMHNSDGVFRPWNGYLGNVKIYGEKNGEVRDYYFNCGDFGRWGEYQTDGEILPNLMGDGGATLNCCKQYGDKPFDGYRSVSVNVDVEPYKEEGRQEILNKLKPINITENGHYDIYELQNVKYLNFGQDNNVWFSTNKNITKNSEIELAFMLSNENHSENTLIATQNGFKVTFSGGGLRGIIGDKNTYNIGYYEGAFAVNYVKVNKEGLTCNENFVGWNGNEWGENLWDNLTENVELLVGTDTNNSEYNFKNALLWVKIDGVLYEANENLNFVADDGSTFVKGGSGEPTFYYADVHKYDGSGWREISVNVPTIQEQIRDYYYCPLIVASAGFGEAAKNWDENDVVLNGYDGDILNVLYVPTFGNRNEFRTKEKARFVQRIDIPSDSIGSLEFGDGVEYYVNNSGEHTYTNLTKIVLGDNMETLNFSGNDRFPALNEIWDYSITSEFDVYFSIPNVKGGGTVYLKNQNHESKWRNKLPEDWTIEYI